MPDRVGFTDGATVALEQRGSGVYYYTSRRIGRRVVKRYIGSGPVAEAAAQLDLAERQLRQLDRVAARLDLDDLREQNAALRAWLSAVDGVAAAALELCGWHRPRRQWRKRRGTTVGTLATVDQLPWVPSELAERAGALDPDTIEKAGKGDRAAVTAVDEFLDNPAARAYWGDLGRHVLGKWAQQYAGKNVVMQRGMLRFRWHCRFTPASV